jgi:hypothetical protein
MGNGRRKTRRFYIAVVSVFLLAMLAVILFIGPLRWWSIDRQIAEIEAERAIPDSENAAVLYRQFIQDFEVPNWSIGNILTPQADTDTVRKPWGSSDHPELAALIEEHREAISRLIEITKAEKCCFPIPCTQEQFESPITPTSEMRSWMFFLSRAINNDIGEGRIEAAIEEYACILGMADHLYQQPVIIHQLIAIAIEAYPTTTAARLIVDDDMTDAQLDLMAEVLLPIDDRWHREKDTIKKIDALREAKWQRQLGFIERVKNWLEFGRGGDYAERMEVQYYHVLGVRRGLHILVALRRYKNEQGHWPASLETIAPELADEILSDTQRCGTFIYKTVGDDFVLYGTGSNGIDEGGKGRPTDDVPAWPTSRMLFEEKRKEQNGE